MYIDIKRYEPGTKHDLIMDDWANNPEFDLWRILYEHTKIEIKIVDDGWLSLGVNTDT